MGVGAPQVSYREAITAPAEIDYTHKKQSGGSGQYARVKIQFEPKEFSEEEGAMDFEFASDIKGGSVPKEYIPGVVKGIESVLGAGVIAGFPVLGMKATLGRWVTSGSGGTSRRSRPWCRWRTCSSM